MKRQSLADIDAAARRLVEQATTVRANAHAPYSGFEVGAAVRTANGNLFLGCNVEISSYGLTLCAERVALFAARTAGPDEVEAVAVVGPGVDGEPTPPCGACRQVLWDLAPRAAVYLATPAGEVRTTTVDALLPDPFGPRQLDNDTEGER